VSPKALSIIKQAKKVFILSFKSEKVMTLNDNEMFEGRCIVEGAKYRIPDTGLDFCGHHQVFF
jgi:flagellar biosynthesis/type III secretory pathway protein FliH